LSLVGILTPIKNEATGHKLPFYAREPAVEKPTGSGDRRPRQIVVFASSDGPVCTQLVHVLGGTVQLNVKVAEAPNPGHAHRVGAGP
jgi:hypothetical protein